MRTPPLELPQDSQKLESQMPLHRRKVADIVEHGVAIAAQVGDPDGRINENHGLR